MDLRSLKPINEWTFWTWLYLVVTIWGLTTFIGNPAGIFTLGGAINAIFIPFTGWCFWDDVTR